MSMNAQTMKIMKGKTVVAAYSTSQVDNVVVEEADDAGHAYVELAGYKWATENISGEVTEGLSTFTKAGQDDTYGDYYNYDNAINAGKSWGGSWSLPSKEQWDALKDATKCKWEWKEDYSFGGKTMNGYLVSDKNDENKSIFLPAAGANIGDNNIVVSQNDEGYYWSSTPFDDYLAAYCLNIKEGVQYLNRILGMSVRPVMNDQVMKVMKGETVVTTYTPTEADNVEFEPSINGHAYVELAGYKWATENVGALEGVFLTDSDPTYGCYYNFAMAEKAAYKWGGSWTVPSMDQWEALKDETKCKWEWKDNYSFGGKTMKGCLVSDKNDSSKFIFLPAAGYSYEYDDDIRNKDNQGCYWSSKGIDSSFAYYFDFIKGGRNLYKNRKGDGMPVRLVSK